MQSSALTSLNLKTLLTRVGSGKSEHVQLRLLLAERRDQAEVTLARTVGIEVEIVRDRLARALNRSKQKPPLKFPSMPMAMITMK